MKNLDTLKEFIKNQKYRYFITTYGCQMNEHESEKIAGMLESIGYLPADSKENADIIIFNTCCVRENAEKKTFSNIGAIKHLKEQKPHLKVVVCGCMTQQSDMAKKTNKTFGFVDIVIGTHNIHTLPELIAERFENEDKKRICSVWEEEGQVVEGVPIKRNEHFAAGVNIMYGCNNFCSYCIVPYVRGRERSRTPEHIIEEIKNLEAQGKKEIMLLGQNVNSYGAGTDCDFSRLLSMVCEETSVPRIRFMTSHPKDLSDSLIDVIARYPQICNHIHLPVQSGSTQILKVMNRKYTRDDYLRLVERIRNKIPNVALTTDIIIGFPGETDRDFEDTISLVEKVRYDAAFTFVYSKRSGTVAAKMENQVAEDIKSQRIARLVEVQNAITEAVNKSYEGSVQRVLVEDVSTRNDSDVCGKSECFKTVNFSGSKDLIGKFCDVEITKGKKTTLYGKLLKEY